MTSKFIESASGYQLRFQIAECWRKMQDSCKLPLYFYDSETAPTNFSNLKLKGDHGRNALMEHMFHIAVENSQLENYFTEKVMDCFLTKTVPIYFGCPNISDYFNTDGMFVVNSMTELYDVLFELKTDAYEDKKTAIEENFEAAKEYVDFPKKVSDEIRKRILYTCVSFPVVFGHILSNNPALSAKINSQHQLGCTKSCLLLPKYADDIGDIYLL